MTLLQRIRLLFTLHTRTRNVLKEKFEKQNFQKAYANEQRLLYNKLNLPKFDFRVRPNSVLLVEPNPYHGEIQPGFVKYFQDLGYNVDIFMRLENYLENPFSDYHKNPPRMFFGTAPVLRKWLRKLKRNKYQYVFLSSSAFWNAPREFMGAYLKYIGRKPRAKHGILMIEHNAVPYLKKYNEEKYLKQNRVFALTANNGIPRLNPHYFGEFPATKFSKSKIYFSVVGGINPGSKNHDLLLSTVQKLLDDGIKNFQVSVIGNGELPLSKQLAKYIRVMGRLNYHDMYSTVNNSNFILALLDPNNPKHERYKTGTTTGSFQLSLGFKKPLVIEHSFATHYNLTNKNAVVYDGEDLYDAMKRAIEISAEEYSSKQQALVKFAGNVYTESLNNLGRAIGK